MHHQELTDYIQSALESGETKEKIYKTLLNQGWEIDVIQANFEGVAHDRNKEDTAQKTVRIILTVGAILIGIGIFSFIAANWQAMGKVLKIVVILASMLGSYALGWYLKEKQNLEKSGNALIFLGAIIYGAGIFLIAQIFNIRANWPDGFILWMIGVMVLAYVLEAYYLYYLAIILGVITVFSYPVVILMAFGFSKVILTSTILLIVLTVLTLLLGLSIRKKIPPEIKDLY